MKRVLFVGLKPESVDYSDPSLPPGFNAEKIHAGFKVALTKMSERGFQGELCMILPDDTAGPTVAKHLTDAVYDCVVIGAGIRLPHKNLLLLETLINVVRSTAPNAFIAFNTQPEDTGDAAGRWI